MSHPWESKVNHQNHLKENVWDAFTSATNWPLIIKNFLFLLIFLTMLLFLVHSFPITCFLRFHTSCFPSYFLLLVISVLPLGTITAYHLYVVSHLICISSSWNSDPCILLLLDFSLWIFCHISTDELITSAFLIALLCGSTATQSILSHSRSSGPSTTCIFHQDAQARRYHSFPVQSVVSDGGDVSWFLMSLPFSLFPVLLA